LIIDKPDKIDLIPVEFTSLSKGGISTKAAGSEWTDGDRVGIYMKRSGQILSAASVYENASNVEYTADNEGNMSPSSRIIYYPPGKAEVDFIAYYPYKGNITDFIYPVNVGSQLNLPGIDLIYSDNVSGVNETNGTIGLNFRHMLSRLEITLVIGPHAPGNPHDYNFLIHGFSSTADFSLTDGTFSNYNEPNSIYANPLEGEATTLTLLLLPSHGGDTSGRYIQFNYFTSSVTYSATWNLPSDLLLESGKSYHYTLTIGGTGTRSEIPNQLMLHAHLDKIAGV